MCGKGGLGSKKGGAYSAEARKTPSWQTLKKKKTGMKRKTRKMGGGRIGGMGKRIFNKEQKLRRARAPGRKKRLRSSKKNVDQVD